ncbi:hypothetical protein [Tropicimonas sp. IMCC34043]|uniref:hypothetical protein n=1 Tax=Tropicimonas sp. IMCC34043 TaxID=2248760 RepID=UPI000E239751|nr:hypothetical protein [Tropicimonas sp. IMCC34043]
MAHLRPGNLTITPNDMSQFANSMADLIEEELNALLALDGLPQLPGDANDREVRDRRRFMIAIARGVVRHLAENPDAFVVSYDGTNHHVTINADQL